MLVPAWAPLTAALTALAPLAAAQATHVKVDLTWTIASVLLVAGLVWAATSASVGHLILRLLCRDQARAAETLVSILGSDKNLERFGALLLKVLQHPNVAPAFKAFIDKQYNDSWHPETGMLGEPFFSMLASQRFAPRLRALIDGMYGPTLAERRQQFEEMAVQIDDVRELCEETQQLLSGLQSTGLSTERRLEALEKLTRDVPSLTGALQQLNATLSEVSREMKAMSKTVDRLEYRAEEDEKRKGVVPDSGARRRRGDMGGD